MTVAELIEELQKMNPNSQVIVQKDSEGNGYSPLSGADPDGIYVEECAWYGMVYDSNWTAEDADMDEDEWKEMLDRPRVCILFPVN